MQSLTLRYIVFYMHNLTEFYEYVCSLVRYIFVTFNKQNSTDLLPTIHVKVFL